MTIAADDPELACKLGLVAAARAQRRYWRHVRPEDVDVLCFASIRDSAEGNAEALKKKI